MNFTHQANPCSSGMLATARTRPAALALCLGVALTFALLGACGDDDDRPEEMEEPAGGGGATEDAGPGAGSKAPEPTAGTDGGAAGKPSAGSARPTASSVELETVMESPMVTPYFNVYRPMDLAAASQPLPLIVWANGGCYRSDFTWEILFRRWASAGFVVLALTMGPDGNAMSQSSVADHGALIGWAFEESDFAGMLDPNGVVAAGNSCGGVTAMGLAAMDERVDAVFVLSGSSGFGAANTAVTSQITAPVGYVVGGPEDIAGANAGSDFDALAAELPVMIVSRSTADHRTVSTDVNILPHVAEIALNWMDLALYGTQPAADALKSATVCEAEGCEPGLWTVKEKNLDTLVKKK